MNFLKNNKRFSFKLEGKDIWLTNYKSEVIEDGNVLTSIYTFESGLKITNIAKKYEKYGVYEWVNYIENISDTPTHTVSDLYDCDVVLSMEHEDDYIKTAYHPDVKSATKIYAPNGSNWGTKEFYCDIDAYGSPDKHKNHIVPHETYKYSSHSGRSSEGQAPFFNIFKNNKGYICAIGWSGQWNCEITRENDGIVFKSKIENTNFKVMPNEKFRTSSVVIMPYTSNFIDSQNKWRKFLKEEISPMGKNSLPDHGPLCAGIWGGMHSNSVLERIQKIKENAFPFEYIWMDAGWYGKDTLPTPNEFEGDWYDHTGDWQISKHIHPNELRDVSKSIHDANMKFLLWFEPERVINNTPITKQHPDFLLSHRNPKTVYKLLNLGNHDAWTYCFNALSKHIKDLNIDCYRQDFNADDAVNFWLSNDTEDRIGITQIKYINGLYSLWDALLETFPTLIIDNCASGGRRIDIETLKRSIPLWRSDFQCSANFEPEGSQCHNLTYNLWLPYSGTGSGRIYDEYNIRSAYNTAMTTNYSFAENEPYCENDAQISYIKKYTQEYLNVRAYYSEDFYPLTEVSDKLDVWCAYQFNRPEKNDGLVQVFRRENSPYETACFNLSGICKDLIYMFTDLDGESFKISGKELIENGLKLTVLQKRKAKIYIYKSV